MKRKLYNKRGTCEQWIKEEKYALNWTNGIYLDKIRSMRQGIRLKYLFGGINGGCQIRQNRIGKFCYLSCEIYIKLLIDFSL